MHSRLVLTFAAAISLWLAASATPVQARQDTAPRTETDRTKTYLLGPGDEFAIFSSVAELDGKVVRIAPDGNFGLDLTGTVQAAGLTIDELENKLRSLLVTYYRAPRLALSMRVLRSRPVSVLGAVNTNIELQLDGRKTLSQVLSSAGGPRGDAGYRVIIRRRRELGPLPLASARLDAGQQFYVGEVRLDHLLGASHPEEDIEILATDTVTIPPAEMVYVSGAVAKEGTFPLKDGPTISVQAVLSQAGVRPTAKLKDAVILRQPQGAPLQEIPVDLRKGKQQIVELYPRDILVIEDSAAKGALRRTLDSMLQISAGMAIYAIP